MFLPSTYNLLNILSLKILENLGVIRIFLPCFLITLVSLVFLFHNALCIAQALHEELLPYAENCITSLRPFSSEHLLAS